jgi:hypothetical protein
MNYKLIIIFLVSALAGASGYKSKTQQHKPNEAQQIAEWIRTHEPNPRVTCPNIANREFWSKNPLKTKKAKPPTAETTKTSGGASLANLVMQGTEQELAYNTGEWLPTIERALSKVETAPWGANETIDVRTSETGAKIAWCINVLKPKLNPEIYQRMVTTLRKKMIGPYLKSHQGIQNRNGKIIWGSDMCSWIDKNDKWGVSCSANIVFMALAVEPSVEIRTATILTAKEIIGEFTELMEYDGYTHHGPRYWNYTVPHFLALDHIVNRATGGNINLAQDERVRKLVESKKEMIVLKKEDTEYGLLFGDTDSPNREQTWADTLAHLKFGTPAPKDPVNHDATFQIGIDIMTVVAKNVKPGEGITPPKKSGWLPSLGTLVSRQPHNDIVFAITGGRNGYELDHNDIGSYTLFQDGEPVLGDFGVPEYRDNFWAGQRYTFPFLGSYGHPVPVVNNYLQTAHPLAMGIVKRVQISEHGDTVVYDLKHAYKTPGLKSLTRSVYVEKGKSTFIEITDEFEADFPIDFEIPVTHFIGEQNNDVINLPGFQVQLTSNHPIRVKTESFWHGTELVRRTDMRLKSPQKSGALITTIRSAAIIQNRGD